MTKELSTFDEWTWQDMPVGFICDAGTSREYITGGWRSMRPVWNQDNCTSCMLCWVVCPDSSIQVKDGIMQGIDYDHCKGCGVCVHECRFDALKMIREDEAEGMVA